MPPSRIVWTIEIVNIIIELVNSEIVSMMSSYKLKYEVTDVTRL